MSVPVETDYVIVGGGLAGCVLASRLKTALPSSSILLLEAGPDPTSDQDIVTPAGGFALAGSSLDWQYSTEPVPGTDDRTHTLTAGKTLGGGSTINYGGWSRGDSKDYDAWARELGDERWSWKGLLPYFKRSESFFDREASGDFHGFEGPVKIFSVTSDPERKYPLRKPVEKAWSELGLEKNDDPAKGRLMGLSEHVENWDDGKRQPAHLAYSLEGVEVVTSCPVEKVLFDKSGSEPKATCVLLRDGHIVRAKKEIILSAGTFSTPYLLLRSGIGDPSTLSTHQIDLTQSSSDVGQQYFDHFALFQLFKLKDPSRALALGHPDLTNPALFKGLAADFAANEGLPRHILEAALDEDGIAGSERAELLEPGRTFVETLIVYMPLAPGIPIDGSMVTTSVMLLLPSSRGQVSLGGARGRPHIRPNYFDTALDRACLVHGVRTVLKLMLDTEAMTGYIEAEVPPPGLAPLTASSSDEEIIERIRAAGLAHFHAAGSCPMGKVVDGDLRVKGVKNLRVCDASVFPGPVGGHPMATLYGVAEQAADIIAAAK